MKKTILLFCILGSLTSLAQKKTRTINWATTYQVAATKKLNKPSLAKNTATQLSTAKENIAKKKEDREKSRQNALDFLKLTLTKESVSYNDQWEDTGFANPASLKITNVKYANITGSEKNKINVSKVPSVLNARLISKKGRDVIYTQLSLNPIVKVDGQLKKVVSYVVSYSYFLNSRASNARIPISNSVLASGSWYKFRVDRTGIHRISRSFLEDIGMNVSGVDPRTIKIYGHGGKPLPYLNSLNNNLFDLPENSIQVVGENDGNFDGGDFILFYAISDIGYDEENDTHINPYSDEAYYYITAGGNPGLRVQALNEPSGNPNIAINTFNDYQFHEEDEFSGAKVGRRWLGNRFDIESEQTYEFNFPNMVGGAIMEVSVKVASSSENSTSMAVSVNGTSLNPFTFNAINGSTLLDYEPADNNQNWPAQIPAAGEDVIVNLLYNNGGNPSSIGYLDYIRIEALRQLTGIDGQLLFRYNDAATTSGVAEYTISNASQFSQVWDVTNTKAITAKPNEGLVSFSFKSQMGEIREYVAVNPQDYFEPVEIGQSIVANQNIKGSIFLDGSGDFQDIDYLIITAPFLIQPALRLAEHHRTVRGTRVKVVTTDRIYEEFSSGKQDIGAIRNFVRYIYENASTPANRIKYVGIFGDTSVDYKARRSLAGAANNNIVPTFHTLQSVSTVSSYMSDDYFGMMDADPLTENDEGTMATSDKLDIAIGRILADEVSLANSLVDKIVAYESKASFGNWRNNIVMISDDADIASEFNSLQTVLNNLADQISDEKPQVNVKKIHIDAFQQESSAGGNRYPEVNDVIKNDIEVGALIVNYFGHGGEDGLAKEFIYTKETATTLRNPNRYPVIVTVTCEFTKFDLPTRITAGELTYWNKEGGAIGLITTTRSIFVSTGSALNESLADQIFGFGIDVPNPPAEGLRISKNSIANDVNRRVVFYVGDPALPISFPEKDIKLTTINGVPIAQSNEVLKGLDYVKLGGQVLNANGALQSNYNGVLEAKVFDKRVTRQTLGNDGTTINGELAILEFTTLGETLFNGQATVTNGIFEFDFVVPKDVQIPIDNGKVSFYSQVDNQLVDNAGFDLDLQIGGLNENAGTDTTGPILQLFMNDESFVAGGITNDSPNLIVKLQDGNGINTASGIGHDLLAILDGDEANPFKLNDYYQANVDDYTTGIANYIFRDLEDGPHTISFKAWDTYNNSSVQEIDFVVAGSNEIEISRVLNYPNPFVNYTEFWFNHNRPFEPLEVQVQVFTVTGKVVWTQNKIVNTEGFLSRDITWDGRDDFGEKIGKGVYVYKITVKSTLTNQQTEKFEKLVIL